MPMISVVEPCTLSQKKKNLWDKMFKCIPAKIQFTNRNIILMRTAATIGASSVGCQDDVAYRVIETNSPFLASLLWYLSLWSTRKLLWSWLVTWVRMIDPKRTSTEKLLIWMPMQQWIKELTIWSRADQKYRAVQSWMEQFRAVRVVTMSLSVIWFRVVQFRTVWVWVEQYRAVWFQATWFRATPIWARGSELSSWELRDESDQVQIRTYLYLTDLEFLQFTSTSSWRDGTWSKDVQTWLKSDSTETEEGACWSGMECRYCQQYRHQPRGYRLVSRSSTRQTLASREPPVRTRIDWITVWIPIPTEHTKRLRDPRHCAFSRTLLCRHSAGNP